MTAGAATQDVLASAFMRQALELAAGAVGRTHPNPPVGCVIVADGPQGPEVVGRGFHARAGLPHAEPLALREAGERARGATAYVTLEPCCHHGRTPPCADALIAHGVARVVAAILDPNPIVSGNGVARLRAAGIDVSVGCLEDEAREQQAGFRTWIRTGRPRVVHCVLRGADGSALHEAAALPGASALLQALRDRLDACAIGSGTALRADPDLAGVPGGRDPVAVVFDRRGRVPAGARALREGAVLLGSPSAPAGVRAMPAGTLNCGLDALGRLGLTSVLIEGEGELARAFHGADLVDDVWCLCPDVDGGPPAAVAAWLPDASVERHGGLLMLRSRRHPIP